MRHRHPAFGFTLIELLVVVAIIAILIGILLPALGRARAAAQMTGDSSHLRSLQQGVEMYVVTYEVFPPFRMPKGSVHRATGRQRPRFHWFLGEVVGQPFLPRDDVENDIVRSTDNIPRIDNPVFMDPTQSLDDFRNSDGSVRALRNGSYGYNYHALGNSRTDNPSPFFDRFPVRATSIRAFSRTISLADSLGNQTTFSRSGFREHAYTLDPPKLDTKHTNAQRFAQSSGKSPAQARHGGKANVAFLDGHVQPMTLREMGYEVVDESRNLVAENEGDNALWSGKGFDPMQDRSAGTP